MHAVSLKEMRKVCNWLDAEYGGYEKFMKVLNWAVENNVPSLIDLPENEKKSWMSVTND